MILLLQDRTENHPTAFSSSELSAMNLGLLSGALVPGTLEGYCFVLDAIPNDTVYGDMFYTFSGPDSATNRYPGGIGLLILEVQVHLMEFLVDCAVLIMYDVSDLMIPTDEAMPLPLAASVEAQTLAATATDAPYRRPDVIDFRR